jgi:hypothetical protein
VQIEKNFEFCHGSGLSKQSDAAPAGYAALMSAALYNNRYCICIFFKNKLYDSISLKTHPPRQELEKCQDKLLKVKINRKIILRLCSAVKIYTDTISVPDPHWIRILLAPKSGPAFGMLIRIQ